MLSSYLLTHLPLPPRPSPTTFPPPHRHTAKAPYIYPYCYAYMCSITFPPLPLSPFHLYLFPVFFNPFTLRLVLLSDRIADDPNPHVFCFTLIDLTLTLFYSRCFS